MATNGGFDRASFTRSLRQDIVKQKKKETAAPAGRIVTVTVENSAEYTVERLKAQTRWYGLRQVLEEPYTLWTKLISMVKAMTGTRKGNANKGKATSNIKCGMGQLASYIVASGTISVTELDDVFAIATKAVNMELGIGITELSHQFNNEGSAAAARAHLYRDTIDAIDLLVKDGYAGDGDERFAALSTAERRTLTRNFSEAKTAFAKMGTHFASVRVEAEAKRMHLDVASKDWLTWNEMIHFKAFVEGQAMELLHTHETNGALTMAQKTRFHGLFQAVVLFSLLGQRADVITGLTVQVMDAGKDAEAATGAGSGAIEEGGVMDALRGQVPDDVLARIAAVEAKSEHPIARAIVGERRLVLADEPTGELDHATGSEVMQCLRQLQQSLGTTVVVVTHDESYVGDGDAVHPALAETLKAIADVDRAIRRIVRTREAKAEKARQRQAKLDEAARRRREAAAKRGK